ncbi:cytidine deaminase [Pyxidicoccus fallax]|uniref:Cytidine deaminase n=1 Tax=Pyxidicoccus fallax TaxID=394095 RepID=A0A848LTD8_9BACT|nr:anti-phage dCTP deaminase [Pyxidicoccus fallax]NMO21237.1 cytidine deaminase [Pyxidicoccus fallax]NPC84947.1 cytidine deaminase [Pyxidicoccus fallax]
MALRFSGTFDELQTKLAVLKGQGQWRHVNDNQKQFQHNNGGVANWYPSTGSFYFQGKDEGRKKLEEVVTAALSDTAGGSAAASEQTAPPSPQPSTSVKSTERKPQASQTTESSRSEAPSPAASGIAESAPTGHTPLGQTFSESELIIGLVGAVGTELKKVIDTLSDRLKVFGYVVSQIRVSDEIITTISTKNKTDHQSEFNRIESMMNAGDLARKESGDNAVLALGIAAKIAHDRTSKTHLPRRAYIVNSLKHPEEVERLREIYPQGFYLLGVHSDQPRRHQYLVNEKRLTPEQATLLMDRDENENLEYGQRTSDTFHMSDFFVRLDGNDDKLKDSIWRILDILFGDPYRTPTFDEFAMFMAFSASLRSADLSRQVGAVVAKDNEILATGANDCPRFGGGLYWPDYDEGKRRIVDRDDGRDYMRGQDSNKFEQARIIDDIIKNVEAVADKEKFRKALEQTRISDLTEFGRVVHAEMESLLACARNSISARGATVYCTTFPCHNCAKHIIAAGVRRVVYVEPYPKSKAAEFHTDSITLGFSDNEKTVRFEPFVGVGPRRFFDLFSMRLGSGYRLKRKDRNGATLQWKPESARLRIQMLPFSYLDLETAAGRLFSQHRKKLGAQS